MRRGRWIDTLSHDLDDVPMHGSSRFSQLAALSLLLALAACGSDIVDPKPDGGGGPSQPDASTDGGTDAGPVDPLDCGNGTLQAGEGCDDGNVNDGDGCSSVCSVETTENGWICRTPGQPCTRNVCGDGVRGLKEACDDFNSRSGDGCSATCAVESGWNCPSTGGNCQAAQCGDGIVAGDEECEDGNSVANDGCSATCRLEDGYKCPTPGQACSRTTCGDKKVEGTEQCDDGNNDMGDGCSPLCKREPSCTDGNCTAICGDNLILPGSTEECDDGNVRDNDGCSSQCKLEAGFQCKQIESEPPPEVKIPVVYRDFIGNDQTNQAQRHTDFENKNGSEKGIVKADLVNNKPAYAKAGVSSSTTHGEALFNQWYTDSARSKTQVDQLTLTQQKDGQGKPTGTYVFSNNTFFPMDKKGWVASGNEPERSGHNFSFTSEVRYWFEYKGTEKLEFTGDDDVWVFVNKKLALDLGGVHSAENGTVDLTPASAATKYNLRKGGVYEAVVFQAERHTNASNYKLTLGNFTTKRTECTSSCGDGVVQPPEECDTGTNPGGYGQCAPGCIRGPRCGDGIVQEAFGESCDDGNDDDEDLCSNTCKPRIG
jgi:fibro-slime domain-containing protein